MPNGYRFTTGKKYWGPSTPLFLDPAASRHGNCQISLPRCSCAAHHCSSAVCTPLGHRENLDSGWPVQQAARVHRMNRSSVSRLAMVAARSCALARRWSKPSTSRDIRQSRTRSSRSSIIGRWRIATSTQSYNAWCVLCGRDVQIVHIAARPRSVRVNKEQIRHRTSHVVRKLICVVICIGTCCMQL